MATGSPIDTELEPQYSPKWLDIPFSSTDWSMPTPGVKGTREPAKKSAPGAGAGAGEKRRKGPWITEPRKPGWALTQERLAALSPTLRQRHLLFGDVLDDTGEVTSMFPRESVELPYGMPDPRTWTQALELPSERQDRLLGTLKAAEARSRVRALRLRYTRMRVGRSERTQCIF